MTNGKKDRLDRIEELLEANAKQIAETNKTLAGTNRSFAKTKELLDMTAAQTAENWKAMKRSRAEFRADLAKSRKEHDREMKEIRLELKNLIRRIAS